MNRYESPCKDCGKRYPACHDRCTAYGEWIKAHRRRVKPKREDVEVYSYIRDATEKRFGREEF